jgi:S1-C subfamily serine protease
MLRWTCAGAVGLLLAGGLAPSEAGEGPQKRSWSGSRGRLGVSLADVESADVQRLRLPAETGARVSDVTEDSPAAAAGLKEDDVILRFRGETVHSASQLARLVRETPPGRKVQLEVSRQGSVQQLSATLGEGKGFGMAQLGDLSELEKLGDLRELLPPTPPDMPDVPNPPNIPNFQWRGQLDDDVRDAVRMATRSRGPRLGIRYHELSDQLAGYFKVDDGLLVSSVDEESPAAKAGVKAGDVIVKLNGRKVTDASDLGSEVARLEPGQEATLTVQRDGHPLDLKVTVAGARSRRVPRGPST